MPGTIEEPPNHNLRIAVCYRSGAVTVVMKEPRQTTYSDQKMTNPQKYSFKATCSCRGLLTVDVIMPKSLAPTVASGPWNCGWLNALKASARNSPCIPSLILDKRNSLKIDISKFLAPG